MIAGIWKILTWYLTTKQITVSRLISRDRIGWYLGFTDILILAKTVDFIGLSTKHCHIPQTSRQLAQENTTKRDSYLAAMLAGAFSWADKMNHGARLGHPSQDKNIIRNPNKSSKISKDLDCSLVSNVNFSEILPSNGWHPGPGKVGQGGLEVLHLWCHLQKICISKQRTFFECRLENLASFEPFTGSVALNGQEKFLHKATWVSVFFSWKSLKAARCQSVKVQKLN